MQAGGPMMASDEVGEKARGDEETGDGYSIRVASRLTGISAHTLRMWERRYGFPVPQRTAGGARRYTGDDVTSLKLIARALDAGYRPHEVVGKSLIALEKILSEQIVVSAPPRGSAPSVERVIDLAAQNDVESVQAEVRGAVAVLGPKRFVTDFAHPVVVALGEAWSAGRLTVAQEHWTTEVITTQLRALMAGYEQLDGRPAVLLTTLEGEHHTLGLQLVALHLALSGASSRLLGGSVPRREIAEACLALGVDAVGISVSRAGGSEVTRQELAALFRDLPRRLELWVGGEGARDLRLEGLGIHVVVTFEELDREIARWRSAQ
jgi:MerR family transcriptional regulator, light-induced transcriptional regulator